MRSNAKWKNNINTTNNLVSTKTITFTLDELDRCFNKRIVDVYGCLIFSNKEINISKERFEIILKNYHDRTRYEASINEIRIIDFVEQDLSVSEQIQFGMLYIRYINSGLKLLTNKKINYLFGISDEVLTIRFHQEWENDTSWFAELESYSEPVAVISSDEIPTIFFRVEDVSDKENV